MKPLTTEQAIAEAGRKARRAEPLHFDRLTDRVSQRLADKAAREASK